MQNLTVLKYEQQEIRTVLIENEPWWVLNDVCRVLEISNNGNVSSRLDDDEKGVHTMDTPGGKQEVTIISESGLYNTILISRKPEAKKFKRWITHEVLPTIRKTGTYTAIEQPAPEQRTLPLNKRLHMMELIAHCSKDALPYVVALAKPIMESEPKPDPVPEPKLNQNIISENEELSESIKLDRSSPEGWKSPFSRTTLRKEMRRKNLSKHDLSVLSGVGVGLLHKYLLGKMTPGYENREKICKALGKPNTWLDGGVK